MCFFEKSTSNHLWSSYFSYPHHQVILRCVRQSQFNIHMYRLRIFTERRRICLHNVNIGPPLYVHMIRVHRCECKAFPLPLTFILHSNRKDCHNLNRWKRCIMAHYGRLYTVHIQIQNKGVIMMNKTLPPDYYELLEEIQAVDFVLVELTLYLDTHPHDFDAIEQFNHYS